MRTTLFAILIPITACTPSEDRLLPGVDNTPHFETRAASDVACGEDIRYYGNPDPDLSYAFAYDGDGRFLRADGVWLADGSTETSEYTWAGDNLTGILSTSSYGAESSVTASYDGANNLIDYTWTYSDAEYQDEWSYSFADFDGANPATEVISNFGEPVVTYTLGYDGNGRLVSATSDDGSATTYTYDDAAGVITGDTDNGAYVGTWTYDADGKALSETWTGSAPDMIDSEETYAWNGDAFDSATYRSGSEAAPHTLELIATETMRYSCPDAKRGKRSLRSPRVHVRR